MTTLDFTAALSSLELQIAEQVGRLELLARARNQLSLAVDRSNAGTEMVRCETYYDVHLRPQVDREMATLRELITKRGELVIAQELRMEDVEPAECAAATNPPSA